MTDAPTTRETADHAELARLAEALRKPEIWQSYPGPEGDFEIRLAPFDAATALESLLSEIAALRVRAEEADALASKHFLALREKQDDAAVLKHGKLEAERQRDEAVGLLRDVVGPGWTRQAWSDARAFLTRLANQGADQ